MTSRFKKYSYSLGRVRPNLFLAQHCHLVNKILYTNLVQRCRKESTISFSVHWAPQIILLIILPAQKMKAHLGDGRLPLSATGRRAEGADARHAGFAGTQGARWAGGRAEGEGAVIPVRTVCSHQTLYQFLADCWQRCRFSCTRRQLLRRLLDVSHLTQQPNLFILPKKINNEKINSTERL